VDANLRPRLDRPRRQSRSSCEWPTLARSGHSAGTAVNVADSSDDRLDSWKQIAAYLKRGVRTVRRWENEEGLPVHRHVHRVLGSVYAYRSEVDAWQRRDRDRPVTHASPRSVTGGDSARQ